MVKVGGATNILYNCTITSKLKRKCFQMAIRSFISHGLE